MKIKIYRSAKREGVHLIPSIALVYDPRAVVFGPWGTNAKEISLSVYFLCAFIEVCFWWDIE